MPIYLVEGTQQVTEFIRYRVEAPTPEAALAIARAGVCEIEHVEFVEVIDDDLTKVKDENGVVLIDELGLPYE